MREDYWPPAHELREGFVGTSLSAEPLLSLAVTVTSEQRVQPVLQSIVQGLAAQPGLALARIWLLPSAGLPSFCRAVSGSLDDLSLVASAGTPINSPGEDWSFLQGHFARVPFNVGKVGQVAASRHPILVEDVAVQNDWIVRPDWARREEISSFAGHPLIFRDKLLGVIAVFSRQPLGPREFTWLGLFANQAAVAIANACTEEALRSSERNLAAIINTIPTTAWTTRPDGYCDFLNQVWLDYAGMSAEQAQGWGWTEVIHPDDRTKLVAEWQSCLASGARVDTEARIRRFDGSYRWFLIRGNPLKDEAGNIVKWYGTCLDIEDRKRGEDELRASELSWREIVDNVPGLVATMGAMGEVEFLNRQTLEYFGKTAEELKNWALIDAVHPEDLPSVIEARRKSIETGQIYEIEHRCRRADGVYRWFQVRGLPVRNTEDKIAAWYLLLTDINDRKKAEEALQTSERNLRLMISAIPTYIHVLRTDGSVLYANSAVLDYFGITLEDTQKEDYRTRFFHPEDVERLRDERREALQRPAPFENEQRVLGKDGLYRWFLIRYSPLLDEEGKIDRWYAAATEIDDRKRAADRLRQSEEDLRAITDTIRQPINVLAPDGTMLYANRVALDNSGLTLDEAIKGFVPRLCHPDDINRVADERRIGLLERVPFDLEMRLLHKNGQYRWHLVQYNPLKDENGQIIRWYATATDIDDQKQTEERLRNENVVLREEIDRSSMFEEIVGSCKPMRQVLKQVEKVAVADSTVLILGETGTGKELIARALHRRSKRATRVFVRVNCAAIPQSLIASELFGHEKGAFTGALQRRLGRFEAADGGTLFLDEIGDLPIETQIALLRVLQEREFERVGSNHPISIDVRLIAATNRDLPAAVAAGTFRQDLFYRLNVVPIAVPPLRERAEDIPLLVEYFVARFAKGAGKDIRHIGKDTLAQLQGYHWPGNIRELQNVVERAVILSETDTFVVDESWLSSESVDSSPRKGLSALANREVEMIEAALAESHGRISGPSGAAAKLGIPRQTLESKIRRLGIDKYLQKPQPSK
jgi:formate hydrogenlyase transcriptional activator